GERPRREELQRAETDAEPAQERREREAALGADPAAPSRWSALHRGAGRLGGPRLLWLGPLGRVGAFRRLIDRHGSLRAAPRRCLVERRSLQYVCHGSAR